MTFVVAGVSGHTGKVVAESLLSRGKSVRVIVREESKGSAFRAQGAEVAVADLSDAGALARALEGAEGAYLLVPPSMSAPDFAAYQDGVTKALVDAVAQAKVPHVVLLSSVGAQHPAGTGPIAGLHRAERALQAVAGVRVSAIRAAYFMENLAGSLAMLDQGVLTSFLPAELAFDMIATHDIGVLAANLLLEGATQHQVVELGGPKRSHAEAARVVSQIVGKPISVKEFPLEAVVPTFTSFGMPQDLATRYEEMLRGVASGHVAFEGGHRRLQGTTSLEAVLRGLLVK